MTARDRLLALLVAVCWGVNFLAIHLTLEHFPPYFAVALRFTLLAIPTILFIPRPQVRLRWLLGYGLGFGVLQFAFLYLAMSSGMPTGLASLVLQSSAPFTVLLGAVLLRERLSARQGIGILLAVVGLAGIAVHRSQAAALLPVVLTLCGGLGWALGNLANRQARPDSPVRLMLWMSVVPPLPMLALALLLDGPAAVGHSLATAATPEALPAIGGMVYTVLIGTVVGSGLWTALMKRYPSSTVAPFSMLVPVVGIATSCLVLREATPGIELALGALVVAGVLLGSMRRGARPVEPAPDLVVPQPARA